MLLFKSKFLHIGLGCCFSQCKSECWYYSCVPACLAAIRALPRVRSQVLLTRRDRGPLKSEDQASHLLCLLSGLLGLQVMMFLLSR